jgi:hypothetical protein
MASNPAKTRKPRAAKPALASTTDTDKPQDGGIDPAVQALKAGGPEAIADDSAGSAAGAFTSVTPAIVVKGPKAGFRRAGLLFGSTPRTLGPAELGTGIEGARRLLAIVQEPRLDVSFQMLDGSVRKLSIEEVETLDYIVAGIPDSQLNEVHVATIARLTGED